MPKDPRYNIRHQWVDGAKRRWVVTYCGGWIGQATSREAAYEIASEHHDAMFHQFGDA